MSTIRAKERDAILQSLRIRTGALTWADAVQGLASGLFAQARLLPTTMDA